MYKDQITACRLRCSVCNHQQCRRRCNIHTWLIYSWISYTTGVCLTSVLYFCCCCCFLLSKNFVMTWQLSPIWLLKFIYIYIHFYACWAIVPVPVWECIKIGVPVELFSPSQRAHLHRAHQHSYNMYMTTVPAAAAHIFQFSHKFCCCCLNIAAWIVKWA